MAYDESINPNVIFRHDRLRELRHARDLTAIQASSKANISIPHIYRLEQGLRRRVWGITVAKLALALSTNTDYLLNLTDDDDPCDKSTILDMNQISFQNERLWELHYARNLSIKQVASRAGMNRFNVYRLARGERPCAQGITIAKLALALGTSTDYLLNLTDDSAPARKPMKRL